MTRVEFSNLLSGSHPTLHRLVSRMRHPFWTDIQYSRHDGIGRGEWWKERYHGVDLEKDLLPYKFAVTYPVTYSPLNPDIPPTDVDHNVGGPCTGLVTRLKQPIDRGR